MKCLIGFLLMAASILVVWASLVNWASTKPDGRNEAREWWASRPKWRGEWRRG